jgi:transcriptional regulator with XRE-family HTH domain
MTTGVVPGWDVTHKLVRAREWAGLEQTQLAELLGISRASVSNYERGIRPAKRHLLLAWAAVTGVDPQWLGADEAPARPEGLEPPTFCSVVNLFGMEDMAVAA